MAAADGTGGRRCGRANGTGGQVSEGGRGEVELKAAVAKMASHAIFQYNILAIDDTHNTWTNMIVKINIPRLLGSSDDKEKIGVARPEGPPLRWFR